MLHQLPALQGSVISTLKTYGPIPSRGNTSRALITRNGGRSRSLASPLALLIHAIGPRSSTDRAPSFYPGTVRVRVLPRAPTTVKIHHLDSMRPRSSMDQSGGVRSLRLRVRIAPWTPLRQWHVDKRRVGQRQGTAVLTRRDLRVGQVRLLHSPPSLTHLFLDDHHDRSSRRLHQSVDLGHVKPEDDGALR